jgi:hypothetical protein
MIRLPLISFFFFLCLALISEGEGKTIGVLVRGESFRLGFQNSRDVGRPASIPLQKQATISFYQEVIETWRSLGHQVMVFLDTYPSNGSEQHLYLFYPDAIEVCIHPIEMNPALTLRNAFFRVHSKYPEIDVWFITRFDICYKAPFKEVVKKISMEDRAI